MSDITSTYQTLSTYAGNTAGNPGKGSIIQNAGRNKKKKKNELRAIASTSASMRSKMKRMSQFIVEAPTAVLDCRQQ